MLIGSYTSTLGENGRCALPAKFRKELGRTPVVAKWYEECLVVVTEDSLTNLLHRVTGESEIITGSVRDTDRFLLGSSYQIELDAQGRFVIPKELRDYAKLGDSIIFLGLGNRLEIWNDLKWRKREMYIAEHAAEFVENLSEKELKK